MTPWNLTTKLPEPLNKPWLRVLATTILVGMIASLLVVPMSWQLLLEYVCIGIVAGVLGFLDELPRFVAFVILIVVVYMGQNLMSVIAPHWHSTTWQPGLVVLGAMSAVFLTAFLRAK